ncbi:phage/plasmid primase, P4 family [Chelativorans sp. AA-79]|uniref:DNA primase family protein n=1 Tax=Chelativorans sp. AA-79 TaxID=3028735 RepID=UPI0023F72EE0|nr:phage/plasmid primase, P4 family [Chelativorans sp. AA-79]WEX09639.1 phage/plasmid primase, P4 family [Chelativorans sp. AA-79]
MRTFENPFAGKARELRGKSPLVGKAHGIVAKHYLTHFRPHLVYFNDEYYDWTGSGYQLLDPRQVHADLVAIYDGYPVVVGEGLERAAWAASPTNLAGVISIVNGTCLLSRTDHQPPCWLDGRQGATDNLVVFKNGVLDLDAGTLIPPTEALFCTNVLPFDYDPSVTEMPYFKAFLDQVFAHDAGAQNLLQEWFGYNLGTDTSHQKLLLIVGPRRSGKGTIGRLLQSLVGPANAVAPKLRQFGQNFGLQQLIGKSVAIVYEARTSSRDDRYAIAENLLSIVGEDPQSIDRKNKTAWQGKLNTRITLMSNEVPDLPDGAKALEARYLIIRLQESFVGRENRELGAKLTAELPAIMNWALAGLRRLRDVGSFSQSDDADIRELISETPLKQFVAERCHLSPDARCDKSELFREFRQWAAENNVPLSMGMQLQHFSRRLFEEFPEVSGAKNLKSEYRGIQLLPPPKLPF